MGEFFIKDVILTIRTKSESDSVIREEAKKRGVSINSLINQIFERYVITYRFIDSFPCLIIPSEIITGWLDGMTEEHIIKIGKHAGSFVPKHSLFLSGATPNLDTILSTMEKKVGQHSNWYQFQSQENNGKINLLLRHNLGRKWSTYLSAYYSALFEDILNISIKFQIGDNSVAIMFPKTIKQSNGPEKVTNQIQNKNIKT